MYEVWERFSVAQLKTSRSSRRSISTLLCGFLSQRENYGFSAVDVLDTYQHTYEYARSILGSNKLLFSARLQRRPDDEIWNLIC